MRVVPFEAAHLELADFGGKYARGYLDVENGLDKIKRLGEGSISGTFLYRGRIICFAGVLELWPGVCEVWATPTRYIEDHPVVFCRMMKRYILNVESSFQANRVQTTSIANEEYDKWMTWLGFSCEGTMKNYTGIGNDYRVWARIKDG